MSAQERRASPLGVGLAFAAVYVIWGSTYLAIRVAVAEFAPFVMAALRFLAAGAALYAFLRLRGAPRPTRSQWRNAAVIGFLLLACSNAAVTWAERTVPSGLTAVLCAILPVWMVLLEWLRDKRQRPTAAVLFGVALGIAGVVVLVQPWRMQAGATVDPLGAALIVLGSLTWALGSILTRGADLPKSAPMSTAMQMLAGGAALAIAAWVNGDWQRFAPEAISVKAWLHLVYLGVFGSLIALSAYVWLLQVSTPARVSTYAYVNPVVAVFLGWAILGEELTWLTIVATAIIVAAVVVITTQRSRGSPAPAAPRSEGNPLLAPTPIKR